MGIFDAFLVHSGFLFPGTVSLRYTTTANSQLPPERPLAQQQTGAHRTSRELVTAEPAVHRTSRGLFTPEGPRFRTCV